jgi:hypothetical protein
MHCDVCKTLSVNKSQKEKSPIIFSFLSLGQQIPLLFFGQ